MISRFLNFIFPPKCIFCNKLLVLYADIEICKECFEELNYIDIGFQEKLFKSPYYEKVMCVFEYTGIIKKALIDFKFYDKQSFFRSISLLVNKELLNYIPVDEIDIIVAIPLHENRLKERGYNQSALIARGISRHLCIADCSALIKRCRETKSQRMFDKQERIKNISGAFEILDTDFVKDKNILIIDDIYTTGSTLNECAKVFLEAGANRLFGVTVASGRKF